MGDLQFTKEKRLLYSEEFNIVFKNNDYRIGTAEFLVLAKRSDEPLSRIGMVIGKKSVKSAVNRSKVKRLIRETFRTHFRSKSSLDIVVVARPGVNSVLKTGLFSGLIGIWAKLDKRSSIEVSKEC